MIANENRSRPGETPVSGRQAPNDGFAAAMTQTQLAPPAATRGGGGATPTPRPSTDPDPAGATNRPLDLLPTLDADTFDLPWLRGYGLVKSLPVAYQENPNLKQVAQELMAQGYEGILANFDGFMAEWSGLNAAHATKCVTRTNSPPKTRCGCWKR